MLRMGYMILQLCQVAGWDADFDGQSITGRDLCRAVWAGTFDATDASDAILVVAALGWQPEPLGGLQVPSNAFCVNSFAQVELLRSGIDVFVTHGGQNSFTEALSCGTPVVVCPGFGDQEINASKALRLGVGLKVDRPKITSKDGAFNAAAQYRQDVRIALQQVLNEAHFQEAADSQAEQLRHAGGIPRALDLILKAADCDSRPNWRNVLAAGGA